MGGCVCYKIVRFCKKKSICNAFIRVTDALICIAHVGLCVCDLESALELFKETGIVFREQTQVVNSVF